MDEGKPGSAVTAELAELKELVLRYAKQETLDPLKRLGRTVLFGLLGAILTGVGVVFLAVGALRAMQTEMRTTFDGNLSFVPYLVVFVVLLGFGVVSLAGAGKRS